jgi:hypothetical protein
LTLSGSPSWADEGLWLFSQFPKDQVKKKYGFEVTDAFLDHLRLSSVRIGASGSFVSPTGLIFTNHHVASGCIQKVSSAQHNFMANGFYAATEAEELKCPGLEANVLQQIQNVTARVNAGIQAKPGTAESNQQRKAVMSAIEKDCATKTGNRCDVVTLYSGALSHLYQYKKYTDVRLVFAPEAETAFFGGDPDNFTYPRYDLDITFLRAYENGRPAQTPHFLKWSREGVKDGELTFVSGHPASTDRFITLAQVEYYRDTSYPLSIRYLESLIQTLKAYGAKSPENTRVARDKLFSAENRYKAQIWELKGMQDPNLIREKKEREQALRAAIERDPKLRGEVGKAFEEVEAAYRQWAGHQKEYQALERGASQCDLFRIARNVLRLPEERAKPNGERLREYTDAALPSLELNLYSQAPITNSVEIVTFANYFRYMQQELGSDHATVKAVLRGRTPEQAAEQYVTTSKLKNVAERKRLAGSLEAVKKSQDGMIRLVRILDPPARAARKLQEDSVVAVETASAARIARARFALRGASEYPDATGTLRLSFGPVKGYRNKEGKPIAYATDFAGMYQHATGVDPFRLPDGWLKFKSALNLKTPLNFVSTADIIGGNSGSPTLNTKGEVIGIIFDSNLEAMANRFVYSEVQGRAVHVASQGIIEALRQVYRANRVLQELGF